MFDGPAVPQSTRIGLKLAALALAVTVLGLPINNAADYAMLSVATIVIFSGALRIQARAWLAAAAIVLVAVGGQILLAPPRIDEGHNVFLPGGPDNALERGLPADVYRHLAAEFDKQYPPAKRCPADAGGCWAAGGFPDRPFAFSADGIFHQSDLRYNWYPNSEVQRASRDRRIWMGVHRWHLTMPWFEMIRLPAAYVGGQLCWRGEVLWEGAADRFSLWRGDGCRAIEPADAGRRVVGVAIVPESLAMRLEPPTPVRIKQMAQGGLGLGAVAALILVLVRFRPRQVIVPAVIAGLSVLVIAIDDASFLGGVRPFDGGDDGLFYDGVARQMLQKLLAGDIRGFLQGGEDVFYYGGPGLRYFRALEHVVFGESYLGYLTLILLLPFLALSLFKRFLPMPWALALTIMFVAVPLGALSGTTFVDYFKWASRGFADPLAYILFIAGLVVLLGAPSSTIGRFAPAFLGALLLAFGIAMKPIIAPAAAVFLGGAGLYALYLRHWPRVIGLCLGFLPVFSMALHNWVYGGVFVLFSSNAGNADLLVMPLSAYLAATAELLTLNFTGANLSNAFFQIVNWLSGRAESAWTIPLNAAGVAIVIYVVVRGRRFDPWLRLVGAAALAQHAVALFYNASIARYHFLTWFLTLLVVVVYFHEVGIDWLRRRYPVLSERVLVHPVSRLLANGLARLQRASA
jgi:hypothetical protein